jgi:hypothetical protein
MTPGTTTTFMHTLRRMTRNCALFLVIGVGAACGHDNRSSPTAPSPAPTPAPQPTPAPPTPTTRQLSGFVVDDDGRPVPGATVTVYNAAGFNVEPSSVVTDGLGFYRVSATTYQSGNGVLLKKSGYETTTDWVLGTQDVQQDLLLFRLITVAAGEAVHLSLAPNVGSSLCGFDDEYRCRIVHVRAQASGMLRLATIGDNASIAFWIVLGDDGDWRDPTPSVTTASLSVAAGDLVTVKILRPWTYAGFDGFTLATALQGTAS